MTKIPMNGSSWTERSWTFSTQHGPKTHISMWHETQDRHPGITAVFARPFGRSLPVQPYPHCNMWRQQGWDQFCFSCFCFQDRNCLKFHWESMVYYSIVMLKDFKSSVDLYMLKLFDATTCSSCLCCIGRLQWVIRCISAKRALSLNLAVHATWQILELQTNWPDSSNKTGSKLWSTACSCNIVVLSIFAEHDRKIREQRKLKKLRQSFIIAQVDDVLSISRPKRYPGSSATRFTPASPAVFGLRRDSQRSTLGEYEFGQFGWCDVLPSQWSGGQGWWDDWQVRPFWPAVFGLCIGRWFLEVKRRPSFKWIGSCGSKSPCKIPMLFGHLNRCSELDLTDWGIPKTNKLKQGFVWSWLLRL